MWNWLSAFSVFCASVVRTVAQSCTSRRLLERLPRKRSALLHGRQTKVLTFLGYSAAEYENEAAMLEHAVRTDRI
jgi:hypothetical protein